MTSSPVSSSSVNGSVNGISQGASQAEGAWTRALGIGTGPIPLAPHIDPEYFARERARIFRHGWFVVGHGNDIPNPGDYLVEEMAILGTSALVVRGRDGMIRAFHNMCRHRGNEVVPQGRAKGHARGFSCGYHGWTYDLQGKLVVVPDEDQFFGLDTSCLGLKTLSVGIWEGFIFVADAPSESLEDALGDLHGRFEGYFEGLHLFGGIAVDLEANWKICLNAFTEVYHLPFVHGRTVPDSFTNVDNPNCHLVDARFYGRNRSLTIPTNLDYRPSPIEQAIAKFIGAPVFPALAADLAKLPPGVNPTKNPMWSATINIVFPISHIMPWANGMTTVLTYWPVAVDRTRFIIRLYWNKPKNAAERINQENTRAMITQVVREDFFTIQNNFAQMRSGAVTSFPLSEQEVGVRHNYAVVEACLA